MGSRLEDIANRIGLVGARTHGMPSAQDAINKNAETARAVQDGYSEIAARFEAYDAILRAVAAKTGVTIDDIAPRTFTKEEKPIEFSKIEKLKKAVLHVLGQ